MCHVLIGNASSSSSHSSLAMSKLLAKPRWWKKICLPQSQSDASKNYREIIMRTECASVLATTDTSSSSSGSNSSGSSASQSLSCDSASKSSQPDAGKLFPRNMPSIRRSRRRSASGERQRDATAGASVAPAATPLEAAKSPQRSAHQSRLSTVTKLTPPRHKPKANCSKQQRSAAVVKSAVKTKTKAKQLTLAPYDIALELPAQTSLEQPAPSLAMALHSQQSSLISSELSHAHEEHFHSSGISCNGETDDDVEVAMLTGSLSPAQVLRLQQQRRSTVAPHLLPLNELRSLNVCRNRSAVWLHNAPDTEQLLETESGGLLDHCYLNAAAIADDIQLSDIEEQLAKFDGHSKAPPTQQQQQQQQEKQQQQQEKHCRAAKT